MAPPLRSERFVHAADGWRLNVLDLQPATGARATVIAGHAMMVDRRTLWRGPRPSIGRRLLERGYRVLLPNLRGRGDSGPRPAEGGDWSYHDLVGDTATYIELAQRLAPGQPVVLLGHSLFAHTSLAYLGLHPDAPIAGLVGLAMNVWNRRWDPSRRGWAAKRALMALGNAANRAYGFMPAARVGIGTADESKTYWRDLSRMATSGHWGVVDGPSYQAGLRDLECRVLHVISDGDPVLARPQDALRFTEILGARRHVIHLGPRCPEASLRGWTPDHMPMVTDPRSEALWDTVASWIDRVTCGVDHPPEPSSEVD